MLSEQITSQRKYFLKITDNGWKRILQENRIIISAIDLQYKFLQEIRYTAHESRHYYKLRLNVPRNFRLTEINLIKVNSIERPNVSATLISFRANANEPDVYRIKIQ